MNLPTLDLSKSNTVQGPHLTLNGQRVDLESAFATGMAISVEDMPALATLLVNFIRTREEHSK